MYTVIVAEDEEKIRRGIVRNVKWESVGFRVIGEAENGADALEMVEQLEPDLLITDIRMPFINGIELARQIRESAMPFLKACPLFPFALKAYTASRNAFSLATSVSGSMP